MSKKIKKSVLSGKSETKNNEGTEKRMKNLKPFKKGESGNPNGRPPKLLCHIIAELKEKGYERVSPSQIAEAYEILFNLNRVEITGWVNNETAPMFMRIVAKQMLSARGVEMLEKMLDRAHGKSKQSIDHTTNGKDIDIPVINWVKKDDKSK